ncbi:MAG: molybdopterin-guanine dinucleotide biosynthesis protein B [Candidatus Bathyarchaeota archaeon]|nr:molybdopterin-guanine dinucleotide biosynthesis protein B [Candidatus Bathyarchaeota archaeon]
MTHTVLVIAAIGTSGSGKTTTLEYLISQLSTEGYKIGTIKHIHFANFTIDKEGTNTWRHAKAGSKVVVAFSPDEVAVIRKKQIPTDQIGKIINFLKDDDLDIIFIEGLHDTMSKNQQIPKIITAKDETDLEQALKKAVAPVLAITGVVATITNKKIEQNIPLIKIPSEGDKLLKIVTSLLKSQQSE